METKDLLIRRFDMNDFESFKLLINDKMNSQYSAYDNQFPTDDNSIKEVLHYFLSSDAFFAIVLKPEKSVIGFVGLNYVDEKTRNVGYTIHSLYQGKGYGSQMIMEIKRYAKEEMHVSKLISGTAEVNISSCKLLEKAGFILINKEKACFANDKFGNPIVFIARSYECKL